MSIHHLDRYDIKQLAWAGAFVLIQQCRFKPRVELEWILFVRYSSLPVAAVLECHFKISPMLLTSD
jgi:hypothetical protein